jgi:hypothetical protein
MNERNEEFRSRSGQSTYGVSVLKRADFDQGSKEKQRHVPFHAMRASAFRPHTRPLVHQLVHCIRMAIYINNVFGTEPCAFSRSVWMADGSGLNKFFFKKINRLRKNIVSVYARYSPVGHSPPSNPSGIYVRACLEAGFSCFIMRKKG